MHLSQRHAGLLLPAACAIVVALSLVALDRVVGAALAETRAFRLRATANRELPRLIACSDLMSDRIRTLTSELEAVQRKQPPTVEDLKKLAIGSGLRIDRVERLRTREEPDLFPEYRVTFHGSMGGLAGLLHDLEERFICGVTRVELWPHSADGSAVAMNMTVATRAQ